MGAAGPLRRVAIIGGGWAGFASATTLVDAGCDVTVFEASGTLGGRARRVDHDGITIDNGQHLLLGAYRQTLALIHRVQPDVAPQSLYARLPLAIVGPGEFRLRAAALPAPWHTLMGLLGARDCTWRERFAVARAFAAWQRDGWRCAPGETVERLLREQPARMVARLWSPLCLAALNTPLHLADAQAFLVVVRDALAGARGDSDLVIPAVDLSRLFPEPAARHVGERGGKVCTHAMVRRIVPGADGVTVHGRSGIEADHFDCAILATAPWQSVHLLEGVADASDAWVKLRAHRYEPICTIYMRFAERVPLGFPMLQLSGDPAQWVFERTPPDPAGSLLAFVISADGPYRQLAHDRLISDVIGQMRREFPGSPLPPLAWSRVIVEKRATHACTPFRPRLNAGPIADRLFVAGDHLDPDYPGTLEAATRSGVRAANEVLAVR